MSLFLQLMGSNDNVINAMNTILAAKDADMMQVYFHTTDTLKRTMPDIEILYKNHLKKAVNVIQNNKTRVALPEAMQLYLKMLIFSMLIQMGRNRICDKALITELVNDMTTRP